MREEFSDHENNYRLEYDVSPKWRLRAEHFSGTNVNEFGARFRIHEFLGVEYVLEQQALFAFNW